MPSIAADTSLDRFREIVREVMGDPIPFMAIRLGSGRPEATCPEEFKQPLIAALGAAGIDWSY